MTSAHALGAVQALDIFHVSLRNAHGERVELKSMGRNYMHARDHFGKAFFFACSLPVSLCVASVTSTLGVSVNYTSRVVASKKTVSHKHHMHPEFPLYPSLLLLVLPLFCDHNASVQIRSILGSSLCVWLSRTHSPSHTRPVLFLFRNLSESFQTAAASPHDPPPRLMCARSHLTKPNRDTELLRYQTNKLTRTAQVSA